MKFSKTIVYKLHQIVYTLDAQANLILLTNLEISYEDFMLLNLIYNYPEINQQEIALTLRQGKSAISQKISKLGEKNLLKRQASKQSRRENKLRLTEKGIGVFQQASEVLEETSAIVFKPLKNHQLFEAELDTIIKTLNEIYN